MLRVCSSDASTREAPAAVCRACEGASPAAIAVPLTDATWEPQWMMTINQVSRRRMWSCLRAEASRSMGLGGPWKP